MTIANIERRLAAIERQLATIQSRPNAAKSQRRPVEILDRIHGTFANDAAFREAARLGRKWRNAQDKKSASPRKKPGLQ